MTPPPSAPQPPPRKRLRWGWWLAGALAGLGAMAIFPPLGGAIWTGIGVFVALSLFNEFTSKSR